MQDVRVIVGVAGAGKTSKAMEIVEEKLRNGLTWDKIGFSSFSRAACAEAARRASVITGVDSDRLQKEGWFRTIHSCAFRLLGVDSKSILDHDTKAGRDFVAECCGAPRGGEPGTLGAKIDEALSAWDTCRARLSRLHIPTDCTPDQIRSPSEQEWHADLKKAVPKKPANSSSCGSCGSCHAEHRDSLFSCESANTEQIRRSEEAVSNTLQGDLSTHTSIIIKPSKVVQGVFYDTVTVPYVYITQEKSCHGVEVVQAAAFGTDYRFSVPESVTNGFVTSLAAPESVTNDFVTIIRQYEDAKRYSGMLDFTDLLFRYAGFEVDSDLMFKTCWPMGSVPAEVDVFLFDE